MSKAMITKILTALIIIAVVAVPLICGGIWIRALIAVLCVLISYEAAFITEKKPNWLMTLLNTLGIIGIIMAGKEYVMEAAGIYLIVLFLITLINEKFTAENAAFTFVIIFLISVAALCVLNIYSYEYGAKLMLFNAIATFGCDTGAYFFGVAFGKHKMIPRISPNKTWEGSIGGYAAGAVLSLLYGLFFVKEAPTALLIAGALLIPAVAQVGDLSFSAIKRHHGIKDFGSFMPGHGGALDRIDSLIFTLVIFSAIMAVTGL